MSLRRLSILTHDLAACGYSPGSSGRISRANTEPGTTPRYFLCDMEAASTWLLDFLPAELPVAVLRQWLLQSLHT